MMRATGAEYHSSPKNGLVRTTSPISSGQIIKIFRAKARELSLGRQPCFSRSVRTAHRRGHRVGQNSANESTRSQHGQIVQQSNGTAGTASLTERLMVQLGSPSMKSHRKFRRSDVHRCHFCTIFCDSGGAHAP
jgi:hypothetical protein